MITDHDNNSLAVFHKPAVFWGAAFLILSLALLVRVYDISLRPFHGDEGVNYHFIKQTMERGYYPYSHENYHGPSHFYFTLFFTSVFGFNDLSMRASAIMMGWLSVALLLFFLKSESRLFILLAMALTGFSASLVFNSRYAIHESLFVFSGALLALSVYLWFVTRQAYWHYISGLALALLITTKETFIITLFCIFFAFWSMGDWRSVWNTLCRQWTAIFYGLLLAITLVVFTYTGGLQWSGGVRELLYSVPQWIGRNQSDYGHFKPFSYYLFIFFGSYVADFLKELTNYNFGAWPSKYATEPHFWLLVLAIPGLFIFAIIRPALFTSREYALARFLSTWTLLAWLVYSFVSYKTPWLIINITFPASLLLAWLISRIFDETDFRFYLGSTVSIIALYFAWDATYKNNFVLPYSKGNAMSYVHPHAGMLTFLNDLDNYKRQYGHTRLLIGTGHYWPLPYYLRDHKEGVAYARSDNPAADAARYDVMLVNHNHTFSHPDWQKTYYRITDVQEANAYFRIRRE